MAAVLDVSTIIFLLPVITLGRCCKSDPMDALFVSTEIGRATNHFFRNCFNIISKMNPYPSSPLVTKFLKSICEALDVCDHLIHADDMKKNIPCVRQWMWARWLGTEVVPLEQMKMVESAAFSCSPTASGTLLSETVRFDKQLCIFEEHKNCPVLSAAGDVTSFRKMCTFPVVPSTRVLKHLVAYGLKISG